MNISIKNLKTRKKTNLLSQLIKNNINIITITRKPSSRDSKDQIILESCSSVSMNDLKSHCKEFHVSLLTDLINREMTVVQLRLVKNRW